MYDPGWEERFGGVTVDSIMLVDTGERLNDETFLYWREKGATVVTFFIPRDEMLMALKHPLVMITSDGVIVDGKGHPRGAGTFSHVLGRLTRQEGHLTLMEALRKMTIMPAQRLEHAAPSDPMADEAKWTIWQLAAVIAAAAMTSCTDCTMVSGNTEPL